MFRNTYQIFSAALLFFIFLFCSTSNAEKSKGSVKPCSASPESEKISTSIARAGTIANFRRASDSLAVQSDTMIKEALKRAAEVNADLVSFSALPTKLLSDYSDKEKCDAYFSKTKTKPFTWKNLLFTTPDEVIALFSELSQGKGEQGKELYAKCDGVCSPQYRIEIARLETGSLNTDVYAVCGPARDKNDDTYTLTSTLNWKCK